MTITGYHWRHSVSVFDIHCSCGRTFEHAQNSMAVTCPACGAIEFLDEIQARPLDNSDKAHRGADPFSFKPPSRPSARRRMIERGAENEL